MKRILILKMWALGDILMATPMLPALKRALPDCEIDWMVDSVHAAILEGNPLISRVIAFDSGSWRANLRHGRFLRYFAELAGMRRSLRDRRYDVAVNLTTDKSWARLFMAAPRHFGLFRHRPRGPIRRSYEHVVALDEHRGRHNTLDYLDTIAPLIGPIDEMKLGDADLAMMAIRTGEANPSISNLIDAARSGHSFAVVVSPYSTGENRNWPEDKYAALCRWLAEKNALVVVSTSRSDRDRGAELVQSIASPGVVDAPPTSIEEFKELIAAADIVVCGDSSAMHLAAALGTPYIALFGATPVVERKPLVGQGIAIAKPLPCAPCDSRQCSNLEFRKCMNLIELSDVQAAVTSLIGENATLC